MSVRKIVLSAVWFTYLVIGGYWFNKLSFKNEIDPALASYYSPFENAVNRNCYMREFEAPNQISVKFANLKDNHIGICQYDIFSYVISIDIKTWEALDESSRYQLMFHEASHCLFHEPHIEDEKNLMNPTIYVMPLFSTFYQAEQIIKKHCTLWRNHGFKSIEIGN